MPTLFVYLPCYNEAGNLRRLTEEWLAEAEALARTGYQLTVIPVDDRAPMTRWPLPASWRRSRRGSGSLPTQSTKTWGVW